MMAVTPNMKIAEVLKRYPQLLDVLVAQSPHFSRLRNPLLRQLHGRMVNVAQAAAIAGLAPVDLVRNLNAALGENDAAVDGAEVRSFAGAPPPPWLESATLAETVDVRDEQQRKEEPFAKIMAAVGRVPQGRMLLLRNSFEPLPLYEVLEKRGFLPWARQIGPEDWEVYFYHLGRQNGHVTMARPPAVAGASRAVGIAQPAAMATVDVRGLEPPQPMMRILDALASLPPGQTLLVQHVRRPIHLYPRLAELGYEHETHEIAPGNVEIYVRKK